MFTTEVLDPKGLQSVNMDHVLLRLSNRQLSKKGSPKKNYVKKKKRNKMKKKYKIPTSKSITKSHRKLRHLRTTKT